jgi:hypothetical protein
MMTPDIKRELETRIEAHPLAAVAIALVAGAIVALARGERGHAPRKRTIGSAIIGGISALAMGVVKDALLGQLSGAAKSWLDPEGAMSAAGGARRDPAESFLEH